MRSQLISAALLAGAICLSLAAPLTAAPVRAAPIAAPPPELDWTACADLPDTECAGLDVPIDPARPERGQLTLRLGRVAATDPAQRQGSLLLIPGGPGAGLAETFGAYRADFHIEELRREHEVISFDPRGVGQSSPVRCAPDPATPAPAAGIPTRSAFDALAQANAAFARGCFAATGELMAHLSAMDTAADVELIRQAVGQRDGLVAYAGSYGTNYAGAYLERYGEHVQALVLDGVFDHSVDLPTMSRRNALGVEDAFGRFVRWCGADDTCALHGQDVGAVFDAVVAAHPAARGLVAQLLAAGRDARFGWPAIAELLARAAGGDTAALDRFSATVAATTKRSSNGET
jgi:pimeloyl-ACP methyl ester carboxylesterase